MKRIMQMAGSWGLFIALGWAGLTLSSEPRGLSPKALWFLDQSGVSNPVTAVLLNYRSFDTLLEVGVLLLALVALWSLRGRENRAPVPAYLRPTLLIILRFSAPVMILGAGYLLWIGAFAPGGAFQAGALLAGTLILMMLVGLPRVAVFCRSRLLLGFGLACFSVIALLPLTMGDALLEYPQAQAKHLILVIEAAATLSIGLTLAALFAGGTPEAEVSSPDASTMSTFLTYFLTGAALFALGFHALTASAHLVRKIIGMNIMGNGVFMIFISIAARNTNAVPDPVPQAMVLTGIVVAVCATAFALALTERVHAATGSFELDEDRDR